jgi:PAS domain S-box-containing protein
MSEHPEYDNLLKQYRELQLRVTRFSAIEQELINTRDRLDHELVLHQRLHRYNSDVLKEAEEAAFFQIEAEAIVDVFEMECAVIVYLPFGDASPIIFQEGFTSPQDTAGFIAEVKELGKLLPRSKTAIIKGDVLNNFRFFSQFDQSLCAHFIEPNLHYEVYLLGLISRTNAPLYNKPQERHLTIFGVFSQQMQAMLANRKRSEEIGKQMNQIKVSQQELRKLSLIATRTKNGVIITDYMGRVEWINDAFTKITGYSLSEVIGKKPKEFLQGPKTDIEARERLKVSLQNKENIEITLINYDKDGSEYYNQLEIIAVFNEQGEHTNFVALQKDITAETKARQEIVRMNTRFELIAQQSRIGTWEWNPETADIRWNKTMFEVYGVEPESELSLPEVWIKCIEEREYNHVIEKINLIRYGHESRQEATYKIKRFNDGAERIVETLMVAERDESGNLIRVVGSTKDMTDEITLRKEGDAAAERMLTLKTFYESVLNHSPSQKYVFDPDGHLLFSTEPPKEGALWWDTTSRRSIFSVQQSEVEARTWQMITAIQQAVEQQHVVRVEDLSVLNDGSPVEFLQSIMPYQNATGKLEHIIITGVDISELKKVQDAVNRKNDELRKINAELDNFVYSISHDLRSPLLSIKGIVSLIMHSPEIDAKNRAYLEMVDGSATRLDGTIQEILEYSRNSRLDIAHEAFDVAEMVKQAYNDLRFSAQGQIEMLLDIQTSPILLSDRSRVSVLLKNIIGNSVKYRRKDVASFVKFSLRREHGNIIMQVSDNGEGIDAKHMDQIFTMFFRGTTSSIGTGLGLYICKEIVNKLNGDLSVNSSLGDGTTMTIILPESTIHE